MHVQLRKDEIIKRKLMQIGPAIERIAKRFNRGNACVASSEDIAKEGIIATWELITKHPDYHKKYFLAAAKNRMIDVLRLESGRSMFDKLNGLWYAKLISEGHIKPDEVPKRNKAVLRIALMDPKDLEKIKRDIQLSENFHFSQSLGSIPSMDTEPCTEVPRMLIERVDNKEPTAEIRFLAFELLERIRRRIAEKKISVVLMYADGMTQDEIGEKFGIGKSRVCQILSEVSKIAGTY